MNRRSLITGLGAILFAPAIVRADSLMPISVWNPLVTVPDRLLGFGLVSVYGFTSLATAAGGFAGRNGLQLFWASEPINKGDRVLVGTDARGVAWVRKAPPTAIIFNRAASDSLREQDIPKRQWLPG